MSGDTLIIDLTNYRETSGAHVTPGKYKVQVEDYDVTESRAGNKMIVLYLRVLGGEFDGSTIIDRLTQSEKALFRTVAFMQAIGIPTPKKRLSVNLPSWRGRVLYAMVEDGEPYNGRVKSEVKEYSRLEKAAKAPTDDFMGIADDEPEAVEETTAADAGELAASAEPEADTSDAVADLPDDGLDVDTIDL